MKYQPLPSATNSETDIVFTPVEWASTIINLLPLYERVLDPARGKGAFYDLFPDDCEKLWCEITDGRDFMDFHEVVQ